MLIVFDLDETLINVSEHHFASLESAVQQVWKNGYPEALRQRAGVPQGERLRITANLFGGNLDDHEESIKRAMECMATNISDELPQDLTGFVLPGVISLLSSLHDRNGIQMALATGTIGSVAKILLKRAKIQRYFPVGAYGDEGASKVEIVRLARKRAREFYGEELRLDPMVVVGDQVSDIMAGKVLNAYSIGVTTGRFSRSDLEQAGADTVLANLNDTEVIIRTVLSIPGL